MAGSHGQSPLLQWVPDQVLSTQDNSRQSLTCSRIFWPPKKCFERARLPFQGLWKAGRGLNWGETQSERVCPQLPLPTRNQDKPQQEARPLRLPDYAPIAESRQTHGVVWGRALLPAGYIRGSFSPGQGDPPVIHMSCGLKVSSADPEVSLRTGVFFMWSPSQARQLGSWVPTHETARCVAPPNPESS